MRFKTIIRNINLLNIILLSVITIFASYSLLPLLDIKVKYILPAVKKNVEEKEEKTVQTQTPSIAEYTMIAEQNLFHPERKIPAEKKDEKSFPKPEFVLYGTLITDDVSLAYLEDLKAPFSSPGRGKRQTALRKGDTLSGFTLKDIEADKVVMLRGEETIIVYLSDTQSPKTRETSTPTTVAPRQPASMPGQPSTTQPAKSRPLQSPRTR